MPDEASAYRIGLWSLLDEVQTQTHIGQYFSQKSITSSTALASYLKLLTDVAQTVEFSRLFHQFITLSEKK